MPKRNHSPHYGFCKQANKKIMADRIQAELLLEDIQLNSRRTIHDEKRSYRCKWGDHWHLTSEELKNEMPHSL
jgi:hypothetical protein